MNTVSSGPDSGEQSRWLGDLLRGRIEVGFQRWADGYLDVGCRHAHNRCDEVPPGILSHRGREARLSSTFIYLR